MYHDSEGEPWKSIHSLFTTGSLHGCLHGNYESTGTSYNRETNEYCTSYRCNDCGHTWTICTGGGN